MKKEKKSWGILIVPANLHRCQTLPHPVMTMSKQLEDQGHSKINLTNLPQSLCAPVDFSQRPTHGNVRKGSNAALNSLCFGFVLTVALRNQGTKHIEPPPKLCQTICCSCMCYSKFNLNRKSVERPLDNNALTAFSSVLCIFWPK